MKLKFNSVLNLILLNFVLTVVNVGISQNDIDLLIEWEQPQSITYDNSTFLVPTIKNQVLDGNKPNFFFRKEVGSNYKANLTLQILDVENATTIDEKYLKSQFINVDTLIYELKVVSSRTKKSIVLNLFPYVRQNGTLKKIKAVKIIQQNVSNSNVYAQKSFASSSVLQQGSGFWYKISVKNDGIHKIDKTFLEACGVDVENLNPDHIHIYGNGDGRLPELNNIPRSDDLVNNAIEVVGGNDGTFDDNDYILFHAWGPHRWSQNGVNAFDQDRNPYSDISCYFININSNVSPLRINSISSVAVPASHNVSTYSYYDVHEIDVVNIIGGGQRWYGEVFDTDLQRLINFNVPNIDNSVPANFEVSIASSAKNFTGTSHSYSINGNSLGSATTPNVTPSLVINVEGMVHR